MTNEALPHLPLADFRKHGHDLIDWIADYLETLEDRPVMATVEPGDIRAMIPSTAPAEAEPMGDILDDLDRVVMPGVTHWQHPGWFAYFPASSSPASILGEIASAGLAVQGMLWSTSPAATEVESAVMDWLVDLLGLPTTWRIDTGPGGGVLQMSASDSTHTALVVARDLAVARGASRDDVVAYSSAHAHFSLEKGAWVAGYQHVRSVPVDDVFALNPAALRAMIDDDLERGLTPAFVCSAVGTTSTTAVDPVRAVGEISRDRNLWHHVDAAYAGSAMVCPEMRHHQDGLELVDSYTFNPHKWLLTNFDCSAFFVADRAPLIGTLSIASPLMRNEASDAGAVVDYRDWHVPLGRRFRALKLWFVLRSYGEDGLRRYIRQHLEWAQDISRRIEAHGDLELVAPTLFGLVSFRHRGGDGRTTELATAINDSGWAHVTPSVVGDRPFIRISIGSTWTERRHVDALWGLIEQET